MSTWTPATHRTSRTAPASLTASRVAALLAVLLTVLLAVSSGASGVFGGGPLGRLGGQRALLGGPLNTDSSIWPRQGQAALAVTTGEGTRTLAHADDVPAPIASMTKVMTAYLVLTRHPLRAGEPGYPVVITVGEVEDTRARKQLGQSVVPVVAAERMTQRQALEGLLLPSANNLAAVLAVREAGGQKLFVRWMNRQAGELGMRHTRYTDPSGYDAGNTSTAADQVKLARAAMALPAFAAIVGQERARLPYAGTVRSTDELLGRDGFVGIKTGSMAAAGGCFMFQNERVIRGHRVVVVGVVMGQRSRDLVTAGQRSAATIVHRVDRQLSGGGTLAELR